MKPVVSMVGVGIVLVFIAHVYHLGRIHGAAEVRVQLDAVIPQYDATIKSLVSLTQECSTQTKLLDETTGNLRWVLAELKRRPLP